jgi:outer membrane protein
LTTAVRKTYNGVYPFRETFGSNSPWLASLTENVLGGIHEGSKESTNPMTRTFARFFPLVLLVVSLAAFAQTAPAPAAAPAAPAAAAPAAAPAPTATPGVVKVGIVSIQAAILNTNEGQRDFMALQTKFTPKRNELESLNTEVENLKKQLSTTGDKLNEEARNNLVKQIDTKQKTLQRNYEDANNDLQAQQNDIANRIGQKMMEVLDRYAKQNGYSLMLDVSSQSSPVIWAANSVDVTQALVEAYNSTSGVPAQKATGPSGPIAPKSGAKPSSSPKPAAR